MFEKTRHYFDICEGTSWGVNSSVHYKSTYRFDKAVEQLSHSKVEIDVIICIVNNLLKSLGMKPAESPKIDNPLTVDYNKIKTDNDLSDQRDIVWMKFTKDGYCGVVAVSDDINFDIPADKSEYNKRTRGGRWQYNSSGILIHKLNKEWDESFVLVFPLSNIPEGYKRGDIERAIGNCLIDKKVPILDFYSHNY